MGPIATEGPGEPLYADADHQWKHSVLIGWAGHPNPYILLKGQSYPRIICKTVPKPIPGFPDFFLAVEKRTVSRTADYPKCSERRHVLFINDMNDMIKPESDPFSFWLLRYSEILICHAALLHS